jgi:hypothetical protein
VRCRRNANYAGSHFPILVWLIFCFYRSLKEPSLYILCISYLGGQLRFWGSNIGHLPAFSRHHRFIVLPRAGLEVGRKEWLTDYRPPVLWHHVTHMVDIDRSRTSSIQLPLHSIALDNSRMSAARPKACVKETRNHIQRAALKRAD